MAQNGWRTLFAAYKPLLISECGAVQGLVGKSASSPQIACVRPLKVSGNATVGWWWFPCSSLSSSRPAHAGDGGHKASERVIQADRRRRRTLLPCEKQVDVVTLQRTALRIRLTMKTLTQNWRSSSLASLFGSSRVRRCHHNGSARRYRPREASSRRRRISAVLASLLLLAATSVMGQEAPQPNPSLTAERVVNIQLDALQDNDEPTPDAGIRLAWRFAHPANRAMTGPLERFTQMLNNRTYAPLLNHRRHAIEPVRKGDAVAAFRVTVIPQDGPVLVYRWTVEKVAEGRLAGAWMTTTVSPPQSGGDAI